jgi:N-acetylglucosamine-6-phosphate deacetylase
MRTQGLLDLQVNGYAGVDFNDAGIAPAALDRALGAMLRAGVATCLPTLITAPEAVLAARLAALDAAVAGSRLGPCMVPGFHLEGPFLNPSPGYAGCHPAGAMVPPDAALLDRLVRGLRRPVLLLTLAPELAGGIDLVRRARGLGMIVAIGHSAADHATVLRAVEAGASLSTHLGNALPQPQPKFLNPLMAQLGCDGLAASFIADGLHVPAHVLRVMARAKGAERSVLVTDATAAAAAGPGVHGFAGMAIRHGADGSARLPGTGALAGSALALDRAVRNVVAWGIADAAGALAMASLAPAAVLAPGLVSHGIAWDFGTTDWNADLHAIATCPGGSNNSAAR